MERMVPISGNLLGLYRPPKEPEVWRYAWSGDLYQAALPLRAFIETQDGACYVYECSSDWAERFSQVPSSDYDKWARAAPNAIPLSGAALGAAADLVSWAQGRVDLYVLLATQHKVSIRSHLPGRRLLGMVTPLAAPGFRWNAHPRTHFPILPRRGGFRARWRRPKEKSPC